MSKIFLTVLSVLAALLFCSLLYVIADYLGNHVLHFTALNENVRNFFAEKKKNQS